jgi:hypothetical protein
MKLLLSAPKVIGTVTLLFAGYVLLSSLPDLYRYIKINTM